MTFSTYIYALLIRPLELLFEVIFYNANKVLNNPGLAIVALSLAMNFLVLPLYKRADEMQAEERETEERLGAWVKHIKKSFKGDERFMMLQTYYRQNDYKPSYALRGSLSLLLEIPFFIAAYHFLSHLGMLSGVSLGPIKDLAQPDGLLMIGGLHINILPILMTVINIASAMIYSEKMSAKNKIQMYGMALIFLVFLYKSPSGLAFYWTLNNIFSLLKNVFYKLKNPRLVLSVIFTLAGLGVLIYVNTLEDASPRMNLFLVIFGFMLFIPLIVTVLKPSERIRFSLSGKKDEPDSFKKIFILSGVFMSILLGFFIPTNIISSSTAEFVDVSMSHTPLIYVIYSLMLSVGYFVVWLGIFYYLADEKGKTVFALATWCVAMISVLNYMAFKTDLGTLTPFLRYEDPSLYTRKEYIINIAVILLVIIIGTVLYKFNKKIVLSALIAGIIAISIISVKNSFTITKEYKTVVELGKRSEAVPTIRLSKTGKNVVVIMMDRMVGYYIPFLINEKPELKESFDGFTYYPNTVSFGRKTNYGAPGLYGGYEYTPKEMNARTDMKLVDKHNEALKVMPVTFDNAGYDVTVCDPTYAGYNWIPDLSIYDDYPNIKTYITMGKINYSDMNKDEIDDLLSRNFFCHSIFKIMPVLIQPTLYDLGNYCSTTEHATLEMAGQTRYGISKSKGYDGTFMSSYNVLDNLHTITEVDEEEQNNFIMMSNDMTHGPMLVQEPEYKPQYEVDNTEYDEAHKVRYSEDGRKLKVTKMNNVIHYEVNMCAMLELGKWLDYLKEQGVYDNTKIIIVSDHAWKLGINKNLKMKTKVEVKGKKKKKKFDLIEYNCALLVKDFDAKGFTTDDTFMTNADVPTIAFDKTVENPVNPFTGKKIDSSYKEKGPVELIWSREWHVSKNNGNAFLPDYWFSVHDNIFKKDNWECLGYY
ncbi:MAG: YidC/Oxa1 family membrane protein insertase [Eubacterium sp.]|nr:YidC/Oxa1 family membrane protein insertase [Eubacterium sp.]